MTKREQAYDEQVRPLMREICRIATEHRIPFMATFEVCKRRGHKPAVFSSSWHVPPCSTPTLTELMDLLLDNWQEVTQETK